jgi:hypothetical protein
MAKITISIITQDEDRKQEKSIEFVVYADQKNWEEE